jgi:hemerythrin
LEYTWLIENMMKTSELVWQDTQHQDLLALVETLKNSPEVGVEILDRLTDYVTHHFSLEEQYMKITNFPGSSVHIRAHRNFEDKISLLKLSPKIITHGFHDDEFREEITSFLNDWLVKHVFGLDKELEKYVMESDIK